MEVPKKVNGRECKDLIVKSIASLNKIVRSFYNIHPDFTMETAHDFVDMFAGQSVATDSLIRLADMFGIDAEYSEKEDTILISGKTCF